MLKLGKFAHSSAVDEKDVTHITESRIIYRRKLDGKATGSDGFAQLANQAPTLYLDPNDVARKMDKEALLVAKKLEPAKIPTKTSSGRQTDDKKTEVADAKTRTMASSSGRLPAPPLNASRVQPEGTGRRPGGQRRPPVARWEDAALRSEADDISPPGLVRRPGDAHGSSSGSGLVRGVWP